MSARAILAVGLAALMIGGALAIAGPVIVVYAPGTTVQAEMAAPACTP